MSIDITGLDKAEVFAALHAAAVPGAHPNVNPNMAPIDADEAAAMLEEQQSFAYVNGRCMKITFDGNTLHELDYDHANRAFGTCLASRVVQRLRDADKGFVDSVSAMAGLVR